MGLAPLIPERVFFTKKKFLALHAIAFFVLELCQTKSLQRYKTKNASLREAFFLCRGDGIRTHDMLPYTRFPSVRLQPLGHPSI